MIRPEGRKREEEKNRTAICETQARKREDEKRTQLDIMEKGGRCAPFQGVFLASSPESVGEFWLGEVAQTVI